MFPKQCASCPGELLRVVRSQAGDPILQCHRCGNGIDVMRTVRTMAEKDVWAACTLAQAYAEGYGDEDVPVTFGLLKIEGILERKVEGQSLRRMKTCVRLLKALNAPFTQGAREVDTRDVQEFMTDYVQSIAAHPLKDHPVLTQLVRNLHRVMDHKEFQENKFEFYFQKLVPYVKQCGANEWIALPPDDEDKNVARQLLKQLQRSGMIRRMLGKYSLAFDVFHALVACYACCVDMDVVANWVLDVMAKLCRGEYFWKAYEECEFVRQVRHVLKTEFTYKRNTDLYYVLREMQRGDGIESLSANIVKYAQLEQMIRDKIRAPAEMAEMVVHNVFPAVIFETPWDQMAFALSLGHVSTHIDPKTGQVRKGVFAQARKMSKVVRDLMQQVYEFDKGSKIAWTTDTLKLFLVSDSTLETRLADLAETILLPHEKEGGDE